MLKVNALQLLFASTLCLVTACAATMSMEERAEEGDNTAQYLMAHNYAKGKDGYPKDDAKALRWYLLAAEDSPTTQLELGWKYRDGDGVPQDYKEAVKWMRKAASSNYSLAYWDLGKMYEDGLGVPKDYDEAIRLYQKAVDAGFTPAATNADRVRQKKLTADAEAVKQPAKPSVVPTSVTSLQVESDVDQVPVARMKLPHRLALVIGIEQYDHSGQVPAARHAARDAVAIRQYFSNVLGVEDENIIFLQNEAATLANIRKSVGGKLEKWVEKNKSEVFVYFSGHGAPDEKSKSAYLVPYDGDPNYPQDTCYSLNEAYSRLSRVGARSVTVMLDACFSGVSGRENTPKMLVANGRPLALTLRKTAIPPGINVLAASSDAEISVSDEKSRHGLFTYYLLKGLNGEADSNSDSTVTLGEFQQYVANKVSKAARRLEREQTPTFVGTPSFVLYGK